MLARRFTILCLLMMLFSMFFAGLVAEASRPARWPGNAAALPCLFDRLACQRSNRN